MFVNNNAIVKECHVFGVMCVMYSFFNEFDNIISIKFNLKDREYNWLI